MSQHINLYTSQFRLRRSWLSLGHVVAATVLVTALGGANHAWQRYLAVQEALAARLAETEFQAAAERVAKLEAEIESRRADSQLPKDLAEAEALLSLREEIMNQLSKGQAVQANFPEYLRGLARQRTPGIWLTGFNVAGGGKDMEIHGRMLSHAVLPGYLMRLKLEKAFEGREFAALEMRASEDKPAASPTPAANPAPIAAAGAEPAAQASRYIQFALRSTLEPRQEDKR